MNSIVGYQKMKEQVEDLADSQADGKEGNTDHPGHKTMTLDTDRVDHLVGADLMVENHHRVRQQAVPA